jgi:hypothetical protein
MGIPMESADVMQYDFLTTFDCERTHLAFPTNVNYNVLAPCRCYQTVYPVLMTLQHLIPIILAWYDIHMHIGIFCEEHDAIHETTVEDTLSRHICCAHATEREWKRIRTTMSTIPWTSETIKQEFEILACSLECHCPGTIMSGDYL